MNNAVLFGKEINVTLKKTMNNIVIFVDDDGPGIPKHEKENVLKPFYRMDESRGQNKSGVGLGLSISYDIIRSYPATRMEREIFFTKPSIELLNIF